MADVYVQVGEVKRGNKFPQDKFEAAKAAAAATMANFVAKRSGLTSTQPRGSDTGVLVNVILTDLIAGTNTLTCKLFGEFFELPSKEKLKIDVTPSGEGQWTGGKGDAVAVSVTAAVTSMLEKSVRTITAPKTTTATSNTIYIAPFEVTYPKDAKKAPPVIAASAVTAATAAMDKVAAKNARVVRDNYQSGMAGYTIHVSIQEVAVDAAARTASIRFKGGINTYPDGAMFSLGMSSKASISGDISDKGLIETIAGLAADAAGRRSRPSSPRVDLRAARTGKAL